MDTFDLYKDIQCRTNGEIYLGVVGPVRSGKSTFIKRFMDVLVLPKMTDEHAKERTVDELPQSASGKSIMTTEPKFVPKEAAEIQLAKDVSVLVRLIDCVGYMVEGAAGHMENGAERLVKTPWNEKEIPFTKAAEIGTKKVIHDHSTIGIVVTTDGSIGELPRNSYRAAEKKTIQELKSIGKPFVYGGKHHTPMASVSEYAMEHTITAFAPSKTFNVAGLCQSYVVIPNKKLYNAYDATYNAFDLGDNVFGMTALTAAYTKGEEWLTEMLQYLEANRDFTVEYIRENIPEISVWSPEGTYLLWLDCSKLNLENDELNQFFLEKAKVKMNPGYRFGAQCSTYMRLNIGCPRAQLQEALARIEKAIKNR